MNAYERYQKWLNSENVSELTKEELRLMSPEDIDDAFYKDVDLVLQV